MIGSRESARRAPAMRKKWKARVKTSLKEWRVSWRYDKHKAEKAEEGIWEVVMSCASLADGGGFRGNEALRVRENYNTSCGCAQYADRAR